MSGYEDAKKQFGTWDDDDPKWKNYMGLAKKMVTDSNAVAQEKGNVYHLRFLFGSPVCNIMQLNACC